MDSPLLFPYTPVYSEVLLRRRIKCSGVSRSLFEVLGIWSPQSAVPVMLEPEEKISDRFATL
jgi:hypothetical protein